MGDGVGLMVAMTSSLPASTWAAKSWALPNIMSASPLSRAVTRCPTSS